MPKLLAIASTLTALAVLATSGAAFAGGVRDHRHAATPPAANSPPPAAKRDNFYTSRSQTTRARQRGEKRNELETKKHLSKHGPAGANSVPTPGKTTQQK